MANVFDPRGFRLFQNEGKTVRTRNYAKTASAVIYEGDIVKRVAAGTVEVATAGGGSVVGVAARTSLAADTTIDVIDDPEATFVGQCDNVTAYAAADNGLNVDIAAGTPDTSLNRSGQVIDMNTKAVTATLPLKIIGLAPAINGNDNIANASATLLVKLNQVERGAGVVGI